jgi:YidC/Oxa1 family membrane protein insertase
MLLKMVFFPLSAASYKSMAKMRVLTPKLVKLKETYGDDKQRLNQEMMALYKREKVNPLGGCLPVLVQIPVFIALYWVLLGTVEMRGAPWILWITDLSAPDSLFGTLPLINITVGPLPLLMGATMFIQTKLNPTPPDPIQAKVMLWMPIMFTFMFLGFPAGLVLYWTVNNILSIAQQWQITRLVEAGEKK